MTANPEFMQSMLQADPRMQRLMETHPEVRHLLSDPQFMRQRMEEMMNPNMMNEAMRNQDRALSNIEAMPGGMNYLQQMYRSMHEPFAESSDPDPSSDELNRRFAQQLGLNLDTTRPSDSPNSEALPNPWARPNTTTSRSPLSPLQSGTQQPTVNPFMNMFGQQQQTSPLQGNPSHLQMLHQLQQLDSFLRHSNPSTTTSTLNPYPFSQTNFPLPQPSSLSNQQPTTTTTSASTTASSEVPPEEKYAAQLQQLADMGFDDKQECLRALLASSMKGGNADAAVAYLLD
ncbi:hypothetical protein HK098_001538 [Nowakowskiella sp. JEL0407]|nr:hypothetical protein HK098_001538 [Nowakowskiella sp. JEL0407]